MKENITPGLYLTRNKAVIEIFEDDHPLAVSPDYPIVGKIVYLSTKEREYLNPDDIGMKITFTADGREFVKDKSPLDLIKELTIEKDPEYFI